MELQSEKVTIELNPEAGEGLWERVRRCLPGGAPAVGASGLTDLLLLLPDMAVLLGRLLRDERVPPVGKGIALAGLAYLVSPVDFLPGFLFGPIGMIDDLVIAALSLSAILNHTHPDVVRSHWPGQGDVLGVIHRVTGWVEESVVGQNLARLVGLWPLQGR
ncbi:MAG: hypothetical protein CMN75_16250 [Spirochaeta sp.]|nr:hypothetical protein [Spirochaeta sp.]RPG11783.1 MAG: DUF1232 domain-containing protein [Proteobacteria bacterium TMED72]